MAITGITAVELDKPEYSQYVVGFKIVTVTIFGPDEVPVAADTLTIQIIKARRAGEVVHIGQGQLLVAQRTGSLDELGQRSCPTQ